MNEVLYGNNELQNLRRTFDRPHKTDEEHPQLTRAITRLRLMFEQFQHQKDWGSIGVTLIFREGVPVTVQGSTTVSDKSA